MKVVTSVTVFNDAVGVRMSITYSEIDEVTGQVTADNKRIDRVITSSTTKNIVNDLTDVAQNFVDALE